ncbi:unnamed protein product [Rhizoctonia solani]|uniref:Uncharacterized protein n=1 Tax=Rhizoctonia solani TaxID=456999 RepID=A0A8H2WLQ1_9AGAM|nr:unnamed protein product [Rhizoctonia solani]CAE6465720.1 unnamed protein product [Rhizoctonia solani]
MQIRVVGGYVLTHEQAAAAAHKLGLPLREGFDIPFNCRRDINEWIRVNAPHLWYNRVQPIIVDKRILGGKCSALIFPVVGDDKKVAQDFCYSETEGTPANFREQARAAGLPDEFFVNFLTIHKPGMRVYTLPGCSRRINLPTH